MSVNIFDNYNLSNEDLYQYYCEGGIQADVIIQLMEK